MGELRYNPMLDDYTIVASERAERPTMPNDFCPFCPGSGKVPDEGYDVYKYDNDFPVMTQEYSSLSGFEGDFFKAKSTYGKCEVILYHPGHDITLPELSVEHIKKLVYLWCERFRELSCDPDIKYIYIFENRGAEAGVTMPHPHGQLYAFGWIPKIMQIELANAKKHYEKTGNCLICDLLENEKKEGVRMVIENEEFAVYVPYYTIFPYGTHVVSKRHTGNMNEFSNDQKHCLADILKKLTATYDKLFDKIFPYMMGMHQTPVNTEDAGKYFHFHIEFYPPLRAANKQYFRASCETGAGAYCNVSSPEAKAAELRAVYQDMEERYNGDK